MEAFAIVIGSIGAVICVAALAMIGSDCTGSMCDTFTGFAVGWLVFGGFLVAIGVMFHRLRE